MKPDKPLKSKYRLNEMVTEDLISFSYIGEIVSTQEPIIVWQFKDIYLDTHLVGKLIKNAETLLTLPHPNILPMIDYVYDGIFFYTIYRFDSELMSLDALLLNQKKWNSESLFALVSQILDPLEHLEASGLLCGNITLETILVDPNQKILLANPLIPALILHRNIHKLDILEEALFYAPEFLQQQKVNSKIDVYSMGILLYFLYVCKWPYTTNNSIQKLKRELLKKTPNAQSENPRIGDKLNALIASAMNVNSEARIESISQLRKMYLGKIDPITLPDTTVKPTQSIQTEIAKDLRRIRGQSFITIGKVILFLTAPILLLLAGNMLYIQYLTEIPKVIVPDVVGMPFETADIVLRNRELTVKKGGDRVHPMVPEGYVIETKPPAGREVKQTRPIRVFISKGSGEVTVPDVVGRPIDYAKLVLANSRLQLEVSSENYSSTVPRDYVISQTPSANEMSAIGSPLQVVVSQGYPISVDFSKLKGLFVDSSKTQATFTITIPEDWPTQSVLVQAIVNDEISIVHEFTYYHGDSASFTQDFQADTQIEAFFNGDVAYRTKIQ
jgi:eukaryotic-like serine/threonine-protein kinase